MVQKVVRHVVARVAKQATTVRQQRRMPVVPQDGMRDLPKWRRKHGEQRGWHNQPVPIHRKIVMDAVEEKMRRNADAVIGEVIVEMEQEAM